MARASRAVASQHKAAIEAASAKLIRERGPHAVSVAEIMANAGLTHGGFYGHFASKDDLVAVACRRAFEEGDQRWDRRIAGAGGDHQAARRALVAAYLTPRTATTPPKAALPPRWRPMWRAKTPTNPCARCTAKGSRR
ncbi:TetR/AcrR family transcriptional regulator [Cupriavidus campinensis]|uniref:TetR/AcrR family transcriptional regulator n=1 Tax=Cupriavidus campinensis TaxID=151783 RepID=UPI003709A624